MDTFPFSYLVLATQVEPEGRTISLSHILQIVSLLGAFRFAPLSMTNFSFSLTPGSPLITTRNTATTTPSLILAVSSVYQKSPTQVSNFKIIGMDRKYVKCSEKYGIEGKVLSITNASRLYMIL